MGSTPSEEVQKRVDDVIGSSKVAIFSKSYCPFCVQAIGEIKKFNPQGMVVQQIESDPKMNEIQNYLQQLTGGRSVPRVFVGGQFVGGCDETVREISQGKFAERLKAAGAV
uniref:Glutaredoxin domain-containing protein n=1 Tax=Chromera velia CCMP2878 TaxID=1169474 RepID=A0A0G4GSC1_9ALVE|eukprot:Cvel_5135.t1-p1 / transcript=Cvel_5135.t1 / gene=Cvel_5135 / organism=Chromera_velia_CCMP2878 / gene_product=Glutaredoxin, putative / transcript_product=Glutaredoxin, putative / location=Cvel_scaffold235:42123-42709(-) / protein_length=110 / sequence_SO=supercontig / SO=protein_coding / is_pseudo=false